MMPPLALTQAKYAFAMFGMSVNEVPGWLVAMAPSAIGVPVAATPGLVPHCDVLTAEVLGVLDAVDVCVGVVVVPVVLLLLLLLLQPTAARAIAAASTIVLRADRAGISLFICPPQGGEFSGITSGAFSIHSHHDLNRIRRSAHREFEGLRSAGQREMV